MQMISPWFPSYSGSMILQATDAVSWPAEANGPMGGKQLLSSSNSASQEDEDTYARIIFAPYGSDHGSGDTGVARRKARRLHGHQTKQCHEAKGDKGGRPKWPYHRAGQGFSCRTSAYGTNTCVIL